MYTLHTLKRTPIRRDRKYGVGKRIGNKVYVHGMYASCVIPNTLLLSYELDLPQDFVYKTLVWDEKNETVRFDEAPDFDTAREPHPGITYTVTGGGKVTRRVVNQIWHHKWLWVGEDYTGFNVAASREWSEKWLGKVAEVASGYPAKWQQQLKKYGVKGD